LKFDADHEAIEEQNSSDLNAAFVGIPAPVWGGICLGLAVLFAVVWPSRVIAAGIARLLLRWGHSAVWAVLALWFFLRSWIPDVGGVANLLPPLAGLLYAAFLVSLMTSARRQGKT
jgi:hypothetical protein